MGNIPWQEILAVVGVFIPVVAFLWEFAFLGRKQLGYRVQMDAAAADVTAEHAGAWQRLERENDTPLQDPSFILLRIENVGSAGIRSEDYAVLPDVNVGVKFLFPGRTVAGMVVTDLDEGINRDNFGSDSGLGMDNLESSGRTMGVIELPRVPLNPGQYYKVLAVLERAAPGPFEPPRVEGNIQRSFGKVGIKETKSFTGFPRWAVALVSVLVAIAAVEPFVIERLNGDPPALDCAAGELTVTGSTAFEPVVREAIESYSRTCPDSTISVEMEGSSNGIDRLGEAEEGEMLAFSDGAQREVRGNNLPQLVERPVALQLFTVVAHEQTNVENLTIQQVRDLFAGRVRHWRELGAETGLPVRLVDRESSSGTRATFEQRVLGFVEPGENSSDCRTPKVGVPDNEVIRCRQEGTGEMLNAVADTPGAIGYSELGAANARDDILTVNIDGQAATLQAADDGAYPFWQTEYAYTRGEPEADSLAASFLRYMTNQVGRDVIRSFGHLPCSELENPTLCRPT